jgi:hypothetical protein
MRLAPSILVLVFAAQASAQVGGAWPAPSPDPLRFASLPLELDALAAAPEPGWSLSAETAYFNTWYLSWHPGAIHEELGREGLPLSSVELRTLEERHPGDAIHFTDLEGWRAVLRAQYAFAGGIVATLDMPWVDTTGPHWDAVAEEFHATVQSGPGGRDLFPRGRNALYVRGEDGGSLERLEGLDEAGIGDVALTLAVPAGRALGGEHRLAVAVEAPTGDEDTLRGSGGWDAGVRWSGAWRWTKSELTGALGFTRLDSGGSFLGAEREDVWHAACAWRFALGERWQGRVIGRLDGSPLSGFTGAKPGDPGFYLMLGLRRDLGAGWIAFDLGENYPLLGVTPDYSFHLSGGFRLPAAGGERGRS